MSDPVNPSLQEQVEELTAEVDRLTQLIDAHIRRAVMTHRGWALLTNHNGHDAVWVKGSLEAPAGPFDRRAVLAVCDAHIDVTAGRWPLPTEVPSEAS